MELFLYSFVTTLLIICTGIQIFYRAFFITHIAKIFWGTIGVTAAFLTYESGAQYFEWLTSGPPASFLIPPYAPISYFIFYAGTRFWLPHLLSLAFGGIAFLIAKYLNKKFADRFFYPEEYYLIALGIFLCVHPFWLGFLAVTAASYIVYALATTLIKDSKTRASFYYLWLPAALLITLLTPLLKTLPALSVFNL